MYHPLLPSYPLVAGSLEVGKHLDWQLGPFVVHGETMITTWMVMGVLIGGMFLASRKLQRVPSGGQAFLEYAYDFVSGIARDQIGPKAYKKWLPLTGTIFLFVFISNWLGQLPLKFIHLPEGELASPTNNINTTVGLALIVSAAYLYAGIKKKGLSYFKYYVEPFPLILPLKVLEDFIRPLSLSFRLFGNILAEELTLGVLILLVPLFVPLPMMLLFLFTGAIQALIFSTLAAAYIGEAIHEEHEEH
ncbi:MAG: F0F1 ATP synthase subunit A [Gloeobacterales cyanobacterium]